MRQIIFIIISVGMKDNDDVIIIHIKIIIFILGFIAGILLGK
jgi:hypothetical protein|nr:MAG TPA: Protein of unknown function (DUF1043) [Caudoviricetes sp.]